MKFGIDIRGKKTGADIYVIIFQAVSLLPALYIIISSGYMALLGERNILTGLFDFGVCALPKAESLLLSFLYRLFSNELIVYFVLLFISLALGLIAKRLLRGSRKTAIVFHRVLIALIAADIVFRFVPYGAYKGVSSVYVICAFALRIVCLALVAVDLAEDRREKQI